jgi:DNA-binding response OmpR family regulator
MSAKILVADESPTIHKIVAMAFEDQGITVEGISRGEHVLEYMVKYRPDIVLADIHLPGIDGYELCRQIKNSPTFGSTRVILLTSDFEDIDQVELEISRADDFISKPFKTEEILKKVKSQLKLPEPEKEVPAKEEESPPTSGNKEIIQNEFEDIVNQPKESTSDPLKKLFVEDKDSQPSIERIDLETETPPQLKVNEYRKENPQTAEKTSDDKEHFQDDPKNDEVLSEIIANLSEEDFQAQTRPVRVKAGDLNSMFKSVLSSPKSGLEDGAKPKPGAKPNLIEETLSFMAKQHIEEEPEIFSTPEPATGKTLQPSGDSADPSLGHQIIKEHMDQVMDRLPEDARQGNSHATLEKTVREVLGEVAPKIIRKVIQEEIEIIKKTKEA